MFEKIYQTIEECHSLGSMLYNEACLKVNNGMNVSINMMRGTTDCYKCDMSLWQTINADDNDFLAVDISRTYVFGFVSTEGASCNITYNFEQHGFYTWNADFACKPVRQKHPPDNPYAPVYLVFILFQIFLLTALLWKLAKCYGVIDHVLVKLKKIREIEKKISETATTVTTSHTSTDVPVQQIVATQVFRGLSVFGIIIFHGESTRYWFMKPSVWNGIMPSDFVYPWFLWAMGLLMYQKYRTSLLLGVRRMAACYEIMLRSFRYIIFGFFLETFESNNLEFARFPGEMQRYGLAHFIMFILEMCFIKKNIEIINTYKPKDLLDCLPQTIFTLICLLMHLLITYMLPVPDCPSGYTGPGGLHLYSSYFNCTGGAARFIDVMVFGESHMLKGNLCTKIYNCQPFDTEGILGTLNVLLTVYSGIQAARIFVYYSKTNHRIIMLLTWGLTQMFLGLCLCGFVKEEGLIPLNKSLWSLSFALLTSGTAFLVFTVIYIVVDVHDWWSGTPCYEAGFNAMLLYFGHQILGYSFPFSWVQVNKTAYSEFVMMDTITIVFWIIVAKVAYKKGRILLL